MPEGLKEQLVHIRKLRKVAVKIAKSNSHVSFLEKCQFEEILPKGLNLIQLTTSGELWKANTEQIKSLLFNCSKGILVTHIEAKKKILRDLQKLYSFLVNKLKLALGEDKWRDEMKRINLHVNNVKKLLEANKCKKLLRDQNDSKSYLKYKGSDKVLKRKKVRRLRKRKKKVRRNDDLIEDRVEGNSNNINGLEESVQGVINDCNLGRVVEETQEDTTLVLGNINESFEDNSESLVNNSEILMNNSEVLVDSSNEVTEVLTTVNNEDNIEDFYELLGDSNIGRIFSNNYWDGTVKNLSLIHI